MKRETNMVIPSYTIEEWNNTASANKVKLSVMAINESISEFPKGTYFTEAAKRICEHKICGTLWRQK